MADAMKLLPCPFCGTTCHNIAWPREFEGRMVAKIECFTDGCYASVTSESPSLALKAWNRRASLPAREEAPSFDDARRKLIHCIEQWDGETEYDAEDIAALADDILDAFGGPPAREEAPGEGTGEIADGVESLKHQLERIAAEKPEDQPRYANGVRPFGTGDLKHFIAVLSTAEAALRNRTSEPQS